jgi:hypothetical protein
MQFYLFAGLGIILFSALSVSRPGWALALIALSAPFNYDLGVGGVKFSICEILLAVLAVTVPFTRSRPWPGPVFASAMVYLGICASSVVMHNRPAGLTSLIQMMVYLILAVYVGKRVPKSPIHVTRCFHGLLAAGAFLGISIVLTRSWDIYDLNKNALGTVFSASFLAAFILWEQKRRAGVLATWYFAALTVSLAGLLLCASRGAWMGTVGALLGLLLYQRRFSLAVRILLLAVVFIPLFWKLLPEERKTFAMELGKESHNVVARLESIDYAMAHFKSNLFFGDGVGLRKEYDATNLVMIVLAETGLLGMVCFTVLIIAVFLHFAKCMRYTVYLPPQAQALVAVCVCVFVTRLIHGMVDHYWGRGMLALSWLSVGLAGALQEMGRLAAHAEEETEPEGDEFVAQADQTAA